MIMKTISYRLIVFFSLVKAGFEHPYFDFLPRVVIDGIQYFKGEDI